MVYGKVLRPETFGAKLESVDTSAAAAMPGVTVTRDGDFVGVTAPSEYAASRALAAIKAQWKSTEQTSSKTLFSDLKAGAAVAEPDLSGSDLQVKASYTVAYIAHIPLEPRTAVAQWEGDKL